MARIRPTVVVLFHPQEFGCPTWISRKARWAKDHAIAYLRAKTVPPNLRWLKSLQRLWSVRKNLGTWQEFPQGSNRPMTTPWHIYELRQFHRTWDGVHWTSSCEVTTSTNIWVPDKKSRRGQTGQWQWHSSSRGQDSSIELEMAWISPGIVESQHPQEFGCPTAFLQGPDGPITMLLHVCDW